MRPHADASIQVRLTSTRVPGKALLQLGDRTCLDHVIVRVKDSRRLRRTILCTSADPVDDPLAEVADRHEIACFRGSGEDVLDRYLGCAEEHGSDVIVRICGDSPLVDGGIIDAAIDHLVTNKLDYVYTKRLPVGTYVEAFTSAALERAWLGAVDRSLSEDLTHFLRRSEINRLAEFPVPTPLQRPDLVLALNRLEDLPVLERILTDAPRSGSYVSLEEAIAYCDANPALAAQNADYVPAPTKADTRLDETRLPPRSSGLRWYEPVGTASAGGGRR